MEADHFLNPVNSELTVHGVENKVNKKRTKSESAELNWP